MPDNVKSFHVMSSCHVVMSCQPAICSGQPAAPAAPAHCVPPEMMQVPCGSMSRPPPIRDGACGRGKKYRPPTMGASNSSDHAGMAPEPSPSDVQALIDANYEFINGQKVKSTLQKTDRDLKRFKDFCEKAGAGREPEKLSAKILCAHIATYIRTLTRLDGSAYEPGSITSAHSSIEWYLREKGYPYSIMGAPEFQMSREVVEAKRTLLKKSGKGSKPNAQTALTKDENDQLWEEGGFGMGSPVEIVAAVWWLFVTHFGLRASHECLQHRDNLGNWYLEMNERITKTRRSEGNRAFAPKAWARNDERCQVAFYNLYMSLRPKAMMEPDSPLSMSITIQSQETRRGLSVGPWDTTPWAASSGMLASGQRLKGPSPIMLGGRHPSLPSTMQALMTPSLSHTAGTRA